MKKTITITIQCDTNKPDDYIISNLRKGVYRALDTSGSYIAQPSDVEDIRIRVSDNDTMIKCDCKFSGVCRYEAVILETKEICRHKE